MFVCIDVCDSDARALESLDLGESFAFDVLRPDKAAEERLDEIKQGRTEVFAVGTDESRDGIRCRDGGAVGENDVATHP